MVGHPVSPSAPIGPQVPPSDWLCRPRTAELEYLSCSRVESLDTTGIVRCCYRAAGRSNRLSARGGNYQPGVQPNDRFPRARSRWEMCGESAPAGQDIRAFGPDRGLSLLAPTSARLASYLAARRKPGL